MKLLISNDDGIFAPGICALTRTALDRGHEVCVCAPGHQCSAASHSITLAKSFTAEKIGVPGVKSAWAVNGTPADCVNLALIHLCPDVDAVLSGINHGFNMGIDVLYSGTVAAAMEGAILGKRALAVSLAPSREDTYPLAADLALQILEKTMHLDFPAYSVLNINYPATDRALGLKTVPAGLTRYRSHYVERPVTPAISEYRPVGVLEDIDEYGEDDYSWLTRGYATLTVLSHDASDRETTSRLASTLRFPPDAGLF